MFLVMMRVTSCSSSLSLFSGEFPALMLRVSWYSLAVLAMNVSKGSHISHTGSIEACLLRTKAHESIRLPYGVYLRAIRCLEFLGELVQVRERQLPWVRFVRNNQEHNVVRNQVAALRSGQGRTRPARDTYWSVYCPLSIEQRGSALGVMRRNMSFACCLCSCSDCSV